VRRSANLGLISPLTVIDLGFFPGRGDDHHTGLRCRRSAQLVYEARERGSHLGTPYSGGAAEGDVWRLAEPTVCFWRGSLVTRCAESITFWHTPSIDLTTLFWSVGIVSGKNYERWIVR
jgi:hypothetical protein